MCFCGYYGVLWVWFLGGCVLILMVSAFVGGAYIWFWLFIGCGVWCFVVVWMLFVVIGMIGGVICIRHDFAFRYYIVWLIGGCVFVCLFVCGDWLVCLEGVVGLFFCVDLIVLLFILLGFV